MDLMKIPRCSYSPITTGGELHPAVRCVRGPNSFRPTCLIMSPELADGRVNCHPFLKEVPGTNPGMYHPQMGENRSHIKIDPAVGLYGDKKDLHKSQNVVMDAS
jgi:hypothetical protein